MTCFYVQKGSNFVFLYFLLMHKKVNFKHLFIVLYTQHLIFAITLLLSNVALDTNTKQKIAQNQSQMGDL